MANTALLDVTDGVANPDPQRPAALNALSVEMMQDLNTAVHWRVAGCGGGGDRRLASPDRQWIPFMAGMDRPVIAKVRGACRNFGLSLMMVLRPRGGGPDSSVFPPAYSSIRAVG